MRSWGMVAALLLLAGCGTTRPSADIDHGHRLATVMGCTSCHGAKLDGHLFEEDPQFALAWSSNLSRILPRWSDRQIEQVLRSGRRPDGSVLWFMPTFAQRQISDDDLRDLIAWLRTVPPSGTGHPPIRRGPMFAVAIEHGFQDSAAQAERLKARQPVVLDDRFRQGRYLATIACAECHGPELSGPRDPRPGDPPDLSIAAAYTPGEFARLLTTGINRNGQPAGDMAQEARKRLSSLTRQEMAAIQAYLVARAAVPGSGATPRVQ